MDSLFTVIIIYLFASYGVEKAVELKGKDAFVNPGGWKFSVGETFPMVGAFTGLLFVIALTPILF